VKHALVAGAGQCNRCIEACCLCVRFMPVLLLAEHVALMFGYVSCVAQMAGLQWWI
jgi:hypothetical protein